MNRPAWGSRLCQCWHLQGCPLGFFLACFFTSSQESQCPLLWFVYMVVSVQGTCFRIKLHLKMGERCERNVEKCLGRVLGFSPCQPKNLAQLARTKEIYCKYVLTIHMYYFTYFMWNFDKVNSKNRVILSNFLVTLGFVFCDT